MRYARTEPHFTSTACPTAHTAGAGIELVPSQVANVGRKLLHLDDA